VPGRSGSASSPPLRTPGCRWWLGWLGGCTSRSRRGRPPTQAGPPHWPTHPDATPQHHGPAAPAPDWPPPAAPPTSAPTPQPPPPERSSPPTTTPTDSTAQPEQQTETDSPRTYSSP